MRSRSAKTKKRKLHHPLEEMERAKRIHATAWWQQEMEDEKRRHKAESQVDFKQPYRIAPCRKGEWEYSYVTRNRKRLIKLWKEQGLDVPKMLKLYGLEK